MSVHYGDTALSHGDEAAQLTSGEYANDLSSAVSHTALLLRRVAAGASPDNPRLASLHASAERLVSVLRSAAEHAPQSDRDLPIRQLLPVIVWRSTIWPHTEFHTLAEVLADCLESLAQGVVNTTELSSLAEVLDKFNQRLQEQARAALAPTDVSR